METHCVQQKPITNDTNSHKSSEFGINPRILEGEPVHEATEADAYDAMVARHARLLNRPFVDMLARCPLQSARVLDVGTGPGWIPIMLAPEKSNWKIWGMDPSARMRERATEHARQAGVNDRVQFVAGQAERLPFPDGHFDLVVSHFVLHHLEHPEIMFNEMARVTRGGGKIIIKDLYRQSRWKAKFLMAFSKYILRYTPPQLKMYQDSLNAALTLIEVRQALNHSNLATAKVTIFRGLDFVIES